MPPISTSPALQEKSGNEGQILNSIAIWGTRLPMPSTTLATVWYASGMPQKAQVATAPTTGSASPPARLNGQAAAVWKKVTSFDQAPSPQHGTNAYTGKVYGCTGMSRPTAIVRPNQAQLAIAPPMRASRKFHKHSDGLTRHFGINKGYRSPQLGLGSRSSVPECASLNRHEMLDRLQGLRRASR